MSRTTKSPVFPPFPSYLLIIFSFSFFLTNFAVSQNNSSYLSNSYYYNLCSTFKCGFFNFTFPFSNNTSSSSSDPITCGLPSFKISCDPSSSIALLRLEPNKSYHVKGLLYPSDQDNGTIIVSDTNLVTGLRDTNSCESFRNFSNIIISSSSPHLNLPPWIINLVFYSCPREITLSIPFLDAILPFNFTCREDSHKLYVSKAVSVNEAYVSTASSFDTSPIEAPSGCSTVMLPVDRTSLIQNRDILNGSRRDPGVLWNVLLDGFPLQWARDIGGCESCKSSGGRCGYDGGRTVCFCEGRSCGDQNKRNNTTRKRKLIIGMVTGSSTFLLLAILVVSLIFKFKKTTMKKIFKRKGSLGEETTRKLELFIENYHSTLTTRYSYSEIKKMTNSFKHKLGQGGYGSVFKGNLPNNGRLVAVKILENLRNTDNKGQDFINEVATIGTIHHVNIIRLFGYCCEGSKRALVYEFMPNGSLGSLIIQKGEAKMSNFLGWPKLLEIVKSIAYGIEYLHQGCEVRILHLDIKPQNILLDENFRPKISDFGLAKLYPRSDSFSPLTGGARGTIGYIAPEIFLNNLGGASHKSDVYSYGMLLLEIMGLRKKKLQQNDASNSDSKNSHYFPDWIYDQLIVQEKKMKKDIIDDYNDVCISRKIVLVALWCIQMSPNTRPSMSRVVEMLSGNLEAIKVPPKPILFSPETNEVETICDVYSYGSALSDMALTSYQTAASDSYVHDDVYEIQSL